jgi:V8-like Glu-specific endopeptidase
VRRACLAAALVVLGAQVDSGAQSPAPASTLSVPQIAERVRPAVVGIEGTTTEGGIVSGTGFLIDSSGTIITNVHVISGLKSVRVRTHSGDVFDRIEIRAHDIRKDIAIVQIQGYKLPVVPLADSDEVKVGEPIVVIGNPKGLSETVSTGIVSAVRRLDDGYSVLQTDAAVNPGNSGGPMLNARGEVIGIVAFRRRDSEGLNFGVPVNYARGMLQTNERLELSGLNSAIRDAPELASTTPAFPERWKSLNSGSARKVRLAGDYVYVEVIQPPDSEKLGNFTLSELKKTESRFEGTLRARVACQERSGIKPCMFELKQQIDVLTPTRIEGSITQPRSGAKLNCRSCTYEGGLTPTPFVWIPE